MSVETELAAHVASLIGGTVGTDVFYNTLPEDAPDGAVGLIHFGGSAAEHDMGQGVTRIERPQLQVIVRHTVHASCVAAIQAACDALVGIANEDVGGVFYQSVDLVSGPHFLKKDGNERWVFVATIDVWKAPS